MVLPTVSSLYELLVRGAYVLTQSACYLNLHLTSLLHFIRIPCAELPLFYDCLVHGKQSWGECQLEYDALTSSVSILIVFIIYSFVWSLICNNVSKVDQIWSITPGVYCVHYFYLNYVKDTLRQRHGFHERLFLITILVVLWGIRLTYNFWRRGGYGNLIHHEEDYRWPILRKMMSPPVWFMFNFTFIATYQNILLWLLTLPAYVVMQSKLHHIHLVDIILAFLFLLLLFMETIADQQQQLDWSPIVTILNQAAGAITARARMGLRGTIRRQMHQSLVSCREALACAVCDDLCGIQVKLTRRLQTPRETR